ncbi:hypothetical protein NAEGRDRAFT_79059 [Naegleria gruberi]|uniref:EF-hand domain-containing protein n=1 Tax=Naegleria gruberi TaxID=5762 RepID=D2V9D1_NAEGR|nr:uncharacterized protein NAEGRDRAFT_79059 [Naegleria gruberi]EFC46569.1 hypothetical protein NAEGRDRAFT_79059 [Naegleria gruberi]|eukprot:XP_002679313.1 hypothetical protein NAEGRDRAFT_79059 [Naegleria gruberi strain NEG-M]
MGNSSSIVTLSTSEEMRQFVEKDDEQLKNHAVENGKYREGDLFISRKGIETLWRKYDVDGDNYLQDVEIKQFLLDLINAIHNRSIEDLENQKRLRKTRAGSIDPSLQKRYQTRFQEIFMLTELYKSKLPELMKDLDGDGDGLVSEEQFFKYLENFNTYVWKELFADSIESFKNEFQFSSSPNSPSLSSSPNTPNFIKPSPRSPTNSISSSPVGTRSLVSGNSISPTEISQKSSFPSIPTEYDSVGEVIHREDFYEMHLPTTWKKGMALPSGAPIFTSPLDNGKLKEDILCTQLFTKNSSLEEQFKRLERGSTKVSNFKVLQSMTSITNERNIQPEKQCAFCTLQFDQLLPINKTNTVKMTIYQKIVIIQDGMGLMHQIKYTTNINPEERNEQVFDKMIREGLYTRSLLEIDTKEVKLSKELSMSFPSIMHMEVQDGYVFLFHPVQILSNNSERENFNAKILLPLNFEEQVNTVVKEILQSPEGTLVTSEDIEIGNLKYPGKRLFFTYKLENFKIGQICVFVKSPSCHYYFSYTSSLSMMSQSLFYQLIDNLTFINVNSLHIRKDPVSLSQTVSRKHSPTISQRKQMALRREKSLVTSTLTSQTITAKSTNPNIPTKSSVFN